MNFAKAMVILCCSLFAYILYLGYQRGELIPKRPVLPEVEEEQLPIIVQHNGHKLLRVDDYETGNSCYFWNMRVDTLICVSMNSHVAEGE